MVNFFSSQPALNYGFHEIEYKWQLPVSHPDCRKTKEALIEIMKYWLDMGCDGFRVDMADSLVKNDDQKIATMELWRSMLKEVRSVYQDAIFVSEWSCPTRSLSCGFDMDFYLDHTGRCYHSLFRDLDENGNNISFFSKKGAGDITQFTEEYVDDLKATKDKGYICFITGNHDTKRMADYMDERELMVAYAMIFSLPGVPFLYYGDEIGIPFHKNLVSKEGGYSRTGSRTVMQWNHGANCGFSTSDTPYLPANDVKDGRNVEDQEKRQDSLLTLVKTMIALRHEYYELQADADFEVVYAQKGEYPFLFIRERFLVMVNPSANQVEVSLDEELQKKIQIDQSDMQEHSYQQILEIGSSKIDLGKVVMAPQSFAIYKKSGK